MSSHVEIVFSKNLSAGALNAIRTAVAASLGVPPSSVTVTVLADGMVSVAISGTTLTAAEQQTVLQQLQQGLVNGSVTVPGLTVTSATWITTSGKLSFCALTVYQTCFFTSNSLLCDDL